MREMREKGRGRTEGRTNKQRENLEERAFNREKETRISRVCSAMGTKKNTTRKRNPRPPFVSISLLDVGVQRVPLAFVCLRATKSRQRIPLKILCSSLLSPRPFSFVLFLPHTPRTTLLPRPLTPPLFRHLCLHGRQDSLLLCPPPPCGFSPFLRHFAAAKQAVAVPAYVAVRTVASVLRSFVRSFVPGYLLLSSVRARNIIDPRTSPPAPPK